MKKILTFAILLFCFSLSAQAARVINSVLLNGSATTTIPAGETVTVTMEVTTSGNGANNNWKSTSYTLDGSTICVDTSDSNGRNTYTKNFNITAPSTDASYTISFYAHRNNGCNPPSDSNYFSVIDGIVVSQLSCDVIFPGEQPFAGSGSIVTGSNRPLCNGVNCSFEDFTSVGSIDLDSNLGSFPESSGSWTFNDAEYNYYTNTPAVENYRLFTSGGTSAIYISGSAVFKKGAGLNVPLSGTGDPSDLLIVVDGDLKIEENAVVNGFIYVKGNVVLEKDITFNGAVSASGSFDVKEGGRYTYDPSMLEGFDPHGFCGPVEPEGELLALHQFEQTDFITQIDDTSGLNNHAENLNGGLSTPDGKYCRGFESESWSIDDQIADAFRSNLDVDNDIGLKGTVSFWFNSSINWDQGDERILFDATLEPNIFALEITQDGRLRFVFEDSANEVFVVEEQSAVNRDLNTWYYVTASWDYSNDTFALYVDGALLTQQTKDTDGVMADFNQIVFGDNASTYTQSGNAVMPSPVSSRGNYDEVRIYNKVLTQSEIQSDMNDDNGCPVLVAEWRMEEASWLVGGNPVIDSINGFDGIAYNGADTVGDQCRYGKFDGVDDYVEIPHDNLLNGSDALTYVAYIRADSWNGTNQILAKSVHGGGSGRAQMGLFSEGGVFKARVETLNGRVDIQTSLPAPLGDWVHVAVVFDGSSLVIYQDGVNVASDTFSTTTLVQTTDPVNISKRVGTDEYYFHGLIDEVRIYSSALTQQEIIDLMNYVEPCSLSTVDHFEIDTLDQTGITCQADNIIIKACADASCSTINPDAVDVELSINNTVYKTVTVSGSTGTSTSYAHTTLGNASLSLDQTYQCTNTPSSTPCNVDFKDSGFIFSDIPTQISGKSSAEGIDAATLSLQAVETDAETGACVGIFPDNTDVPINLSYSCDSGTCTDDLTLINNNNSHTINSNTASKTLRFSADSTAFFDINYPDAGSLILNAQKLIEVEDSDGNKVVKDLTGSSAAFVERPFGFFISAIDNPKAQSASDNKYKKAGEDFTVQLSAVIWQSADDQNNDGVPDIGADLSNNAVTSNFGNEAIPETAIIDRGLVAPLPGTLGALTSSTFTFSGGIASDTSIRYSEVGIINLTANLSDGKYLGTSDVQGNEPYIGRFYPDHFVLNVDENGDLAAYCDNETIPATPPVVMPFAYSGQMSTANPSTGGAIRYSVNPSFTITAKSVNADNTTENYTDDFMMLLGSSITHTVPTVDGTISGSQGALLAVTADVTSSSTLDLKNNEASGVITYTYKNEDNFVYSHELNAEINKFIADINLTIASIIDEDDVTAKDADGDFDNDGDTSNALDSVLTLEPTGVEIRFGRANLENSYGPETSPLPQVLLVEYFENGTYLIADNDICSLYNTTEVSFGILNEVSLDEANITPADGTFDDLLDLPHGQTRQIILPAAGTGNQGRVEVIYSIYDWLKYDWAYDTEGVDGLYNDDPRAVATFGIFRGNDRIIYQREIQR